MNFLNWLWDKLKAWDKAEGEKERIMKSSTKEAHMGGLKGNGYDSNAWVFELLRTDTKVAKLNANNALAHTALLRKIARCL